MIKNYTHVREQAGLSREELALLFSVDVKRVLEWETKKSFPSIETDTLYDVLHDNNIKELEQLTLHVCSRPCANLEEAKKLISIISKIVKNKWNSGLYEIVVLQRNIWTPEELGLTLTKVHPKKKK